MLNAALKKLTSIETGIYNIAVTNNSMSLMQGIGGVPVLYDSLYTNTGNKAYLDKNVTIINRLIDLTGTSLNSLTYYEGLSGVAFLFDYLLQKGYNNLGLEEIVYECEDVLREAFFYAVNDMDFLHGAQGIFMYFLYRQQQTDKQIIEEMIMQILFKVNQYIERSKQPKEDDVEVKINCGLAHGMISYVLILSKYLSLCFRKDAYTTLNSLVYFLLSTETKNKESLSRFPSIIEYNSLSTHANYVVPLGWCYGDNIISYALLQAGTVLKDEKILNKAKETAIITTKRNKEESAIVYDACFCHGSASVAHIYNKWYHQTRCGVFKNAYELWIQKTIDMCSFDDGIGGYKQFVGSENKYEPKIGLLDGACGVALVFADYVNGNSTGWDRFFLLD